MDDDIQAFGMGLGRRAIARDWAAVQGMLAPWSRATCSVDTVRRFLEDEYASTLEANGFEGLHYPEHPEPELGGNDFTSATQLRQPISWEGGKVRPVRAEVTDENVRYWLKMQLLCSDEQMDRYGFL